MVRVTVDYGHDLHSISITETTWARIQTGIPLTIQGQGFPVEGVMELDDWAFNFRDVGAVHVSTDTGRDLFEGNLGDAEVEVREEECCVQPGYVLKEVQWVVGRQATNILPSV